MIVNKGLFVNYRDVKMGELVLLAARLCGGLMGLMRGSNNAISFLEIPNRDAISRHFLLYTCEYYIDLPLF